MTCIANKCVSIYKALPPLKQMRCKYCLLWCLVKGLQGKCKYRKQIETGSKWELKNKQT